MIIEIPNENSIVKWKNEDKDEWKVAEISDLIQAYENAPTFEVIPLEVHEKAMNIAVDDLFKVQEELNRIRNEKRQDEWIPVTERLPEENGEYLVTREAYIDRENRNMIFVRDIAYFTINYGLNNGFHKANTVIAWQPLPELYKEGEKE